jgi:enamine deaminase RidA (YjgF/YER057c/UK114 family)
MDHVLNVLVYLQDMRDFPVFHRVHERFFGARPPALTVVEAAEVGHKGTLIEIEPTAVKASSAPAIHAYNPSGWRAPALMSACVAAYGLAFFSGVIGESAITDPKGGTAADRYHLQATAALAELNRRFAAAGRSLADIAHLSVYIDDMLQFPVVESVLTDAWTNWRPALTVLEMPAVAPVRGACVALTAIGWFGEESQWLEPPHSGERQASVPGPAARISRSLAGIDVNTKHA